MYEYLHQDSINANFYRDHLFQVAFEQYVVPFVVQLWMFATPVAYPASLVPARWRAVYGLNPMAGVIEGFRWALAGGPAPGVITVVSAAVVVVLIAGGAIYFRRLEGTFADVI